MKTRVAMSAGGLGLMVLAAIAMGRWAVDPPRVGAADDPPPVAAPATLPAPDDAAPLPPPEADRDALILDMIRKQLPSATEEEQRIWLETARSMPLESIPQMLQLRRDLGGLSRLAPTPQPLEGRVPLPLGDDLPPGPPLRRPEPYDDEVSPAVAALQLAEAVVRNNLANALTSGFKRLRCVLTDSPYEPIPSVAPDPTGQTAAPEAIRVGHGVQLAATELDVSPGPLRETGRELDVAIDGDGVFPVRSGDEVLFTRVGHFARSPSGRLVLRRAGGVYELDAAITVPDEAAAVQIAADGAVSAIVGDGSEPKRLGHIPLARFPNPESLAPRGDCLFAATAAAGTPLIGPPGTDGRGRLVPHTLEGSNVRLRRELAEWERITTLLQVLQHTGAERIDE